ncbi:hypothetical protein R5R35_007085 [Gryllus longicercus]|uniref:Transmembrane protein 65 n=1 Tax=Gryllus longicercus TaxID=2509291 RepID=A0AAN9YYY3_9ORTH
MADTLWKGVCVSAWTGNQRCQFYSGISRVLSFRSVRNSVECHHSSVFLHNLPAAANSRASKLFAVFSFKIDKTLGRSGSSILHVRTKWHARDFSTSISVLGVDKSISAPLTKRQAQDLILRLTGEERSALLGALQEFEAEKMKSEYEGQLAGQRWRSKFGRPSKLPRLGDVDPTGSFCLVPQDWLQKKFADIVPPPTTHELWRVGLHNALPFIGFGFLDNFFMILFGDTIEMTVGTMMVLSTMAAAALGNTISDVLGIGSAWYVERMACRVGMRPPELTPIQLDTFSARIATNMGRVAGVVIGCLLGMFPLLFLGNPSEKEKKEVQEKKPT